MEVRVIFIQSRRNTPSFSYGDIRRVPRSPRRAEGGTVFSHMARECDTICTYRWTSGNSRLGKSCKSFHLRMGCGGCWTKKPLPLGMGCVTFERRWKHGGEDIRPSRDVRSLLIPESHEFIRESMSMPNCNYVWGVQKYTLLCVQNRVKFADFPRIWIDSYCLQTFTCFLCATNGFTV